MSHTFSLKYRTFTAQMYYRLAFFFPHVFSLARVLHVVLTKSWVPTHSGPGRFSPEPAWTTPASAWGRPSCPCLQRTKWQTWLMGRVGKDGEGRGGDGGNDTDDTQTQPLTRVMQTIKPGCPHWTNGYVEGTPARSLTPFSKLARKRWRGGLGGRGGGVDTRCQHVQTYKHTHTHSSCNVAVENVCKPSLAALTANALFHQGG